MQNILITGGAGFIGSHLVEICLMNNHYVTVLDNLSTGHVHNLDLNHPHLSFVQDDILNQNIVTDLISQADYIFHLAAIVSVNISVAHPDKTKTVNLDGSFNILEACRLFKPKKLFFASSAAVYGNPTSIPMSETDEKYPISPYGLEKSIIEQYITLYHHCYDINYIIGRFFNIFGQRQDPHSPYSGVISVFLEKLRHQQNIPIFGDGLQTRDFLYVKDLVKMIYELTFSDNSGIYNLGTGQSHNLHHLMNIMASIFEKPLPTIDYMPTREGDIKYSEANIRKLIADFPDITMTSLKDALRHTYLEQ